MNVESPRKMISGREWTSGCVATMVVGWDDHRDDDNDDDDYHYDYDYDCDKAKVCSISISILLFPFLSLSLLPLLCQKPNLPKEIKCCWCCSLPCLYSCCLVVFIRRITFAQGKIPNKCDQIHWKVARVERRKSESKWVTKFRGANIFISFTSD